MKTIFRFILFLISTYCYSQTINQLEFYNTGQFKNPKNLKIWILKNSDTLTCEIVNKKINIPITSGIHSVIIETHKDRYVINNVDFSKISSECKIIIGIEKNIENLKPLSKEYPNLYNLPERLTFIKIENLNQAKEVVFVVFTTEDLGNELKCSKSYDQYTLIKKE